MVLVTRSASYLVDIYVLNDDLENIHLGEEVKQCEQYFEYTRYFDNVVYSDCNEV